MKTRVEGSREKGNRKGSPARRARGKTVSIELDADVLQRLESACERSYFEPQEFVKVATMDGICSIERDGVLQLDLSSKEDEEAEAGEVVLSQLYEGCRERTFAAGIQRIAGLYQLIKDNPRLSRLAEAMSQLVEADAVLGAFCSKVRQS